MHHLLYFAQETPNEALVSIANFMFQVRVRSPHAGEASDCLEQHCLRVWFASLSDSRRRAAPSQPCSKKAQS